MNAFLINKNDNVVIAIDDIKENETINYLDESGKEKSIKATTDTMIYHKIAKNNIKKGEHVLKYGEHIGLASQDIKTGEHVHEHNIESVREELV